MKDILDGPQCLSCRGAVIGKAIKWHYYEKFANIPKDNTIVQHPPIHQTDGKRKDAASGLKLSMIREINNQYCSRMRSNNINSCVICTFFSTGLLN